MGTTSSPPAPPCPRKTSSRRRTTTSNRDERTRNDSATTAMTPCRIERRRTRAGASNRRRRARRITAISGRGRIDRRCDKRSNRLRGQGRRGRGWEAVSEWGKHRQIFILCYGIKGSPPHTHQCATKMGTTFEGFVHSNLPQSSTCEDLYLGLVLLCNNLLALLSIVAEQFCQ